MSSDSCSICTEPYNRSTRKEITCSKCSLNCCVTCIKTYLMGSTSLPHCMGCKLAWNDERLREIVSHSWITKEYAEKRKELMFDLEKALLPNMMRDVENIKLRHNTETQFKTIKHILDECEHQIKTIRAQYVSRGRHEYTPWILKRSITHLKKITNNIQFFEGVSLPIPPDDGAAQQELLLDPDRNTRQFIKPCPEEKCNGFLSTQYNCGLCQCKVCPKCFDITKHGLHITNETLPDEHVCNAENIATADLIRKETRNCPKCGTSIYKTQGCDHMFCVHCNTGFNWKTGHLIAENQIHNPHFFQWQQTQRAKDQAPRDNGGCVWTDRQVDHRAVQRRIQLLTPEQRAIVMRLTQAIRHIEDYELNGFRTPQPFDQINHTLRIEYLLGDVSIDKMKQKALRNHLQADFEYACRELLQMLIQTVKELVNSLSPSATVEEVTTFYEQVISLIRYFNTQQVLLYNKFKKDGMFILINDRSGDVFRINRKDHKKL